MVYRVFIVLDVRRYHAVAHEVCCAGGRGFEPQHDKSEEKNYISLL